MPGAVVYNPLLILAKSPSELYIQEAFVTNRGFNLLFFSFAKHEKLYYDIVDMTTKKKIIIGVAAVVFVAAVVGTIIALIPSKDNNTDFTVTQNFTVSQASTFADHIAYGRVQNNTNKDLEIRVTLNTLFASENKTFNVTVPANSSATISGGVSFMAHRISSVDLEVNGKKYTYKIDGGGMFDDGPPFFLFLPFIIVPIIIVVVLIATAAKGGFNHLSARLQSVTSKIGTCTETAERERLLREKQRLEAELAKFTTCSYCGAKNLRESLKCHGCGARVE